MSDVQVSNARRIIFTALALVTFCVLAHRGYWMGYDEVIGHMSFSVGGTTSPLARVCARIDM